MVGGRGSYYPTGCLFSITLFLKHTVVLQFLQPLRLAQQGVSLIFLKVKGQNSSVLSVLMSIERGAGKGPKATRPNFFLLLRGYIQVEGRPGSHTKCVKKRFETTFSAMQKMSPNPAKPFPPYFTSCALAQIVVWFHHLQSRLQLVAAASAVSSYWVKNGIKKKKKTQIKWGKLWDPCSLLTIFGR